MGEATEDGMELEDGGQPDGSREDEGDLCDVMSGIEMS